jgi:hypothetical protein
MAVTRLNPDADVSVTGWDAPVFSQLNTAADLLITDPAAGNISTAAEHVVSTATGDVFTVAMETFSITGQAISQIVARIYSRSGTGGTLTLELLHGSTVLASNTQSAGNTAGWLTATYSGSLTQGQLDDLRIRVTQTVFGSANGRVGVAYADVTHDASGGTDATVNADSDDAIADAAGTAPAPTVAASASVTSPVADATGENPISGNQTSAEILVEAADATGDSPDTASVGDGDETIVVPAAVAESVGGTPTDVAAGAGITFPVADATTPAVTHAAADVVAGGGTSKNRALLGVG